MKKYLILFFFILFVIILLIGWIGWKGSQLQKGGISIITDKAEYESGGILKVKIKNNFPKQICFSSCYPYLLESKNENWESYKYVECQKFDGNGHCLKAGDLKAFELTLPEVSEGLHRLAIPVCIGCKSEDTFREDKRFYSNEFKIKEKKEEVTITTDKTKYEQGEIVKIIVKNNTEKEKDLMDSFPFVERFENGKWIEIKNEICPCETCPPMYLFYNLAPNEIIRTEWNQKEEWCENKKLVSKEVSPGRYRFKNEVSDVEKGEWETIFSNEFIIN